MVRFGTCRPHKRAQFRAVEVSRDPDMDVAHPRAVAFEQPVRVRQERSTHEREVDVLPVDRDVAEALRHSRRGAVEKGDRVGGPEQGFLAGRHFADDELPEPEGKCPHRRIVRLKKFSERLCRTLPQPHYPTHATHPTHLTYPAYPTHSTHSTHSTHPTHSTHSTYFFPTFSYHFRFAVAVPMHTTSTRLSALRSAAAQPAAAIDPSSSSARFVQLAPSAEAV